MRNNRNIRVTGDPRDRVAPQVDTSGGFATSYALTGPGGEVDVDGDMGLVCSGVDGLGVVLPHDRGEGFRTSLTERPYIACIVEPVHFAFECRFDLFTVLGSELAFQYAHPTERFGDE